MNINNYNFNEFKLKTSDGLEIYTYKWITASTNDNKNYNNSNPTGEDNRIKAFLQIVHGMGEHALRYDEFAKYLNSLGFAVYSMDQRGHGKTAGDTASLGHQADKDGWQKVVGDIGRLNEIIIGENPTVPLFILGHSAGSFLVRDYLISLNGEKENDPVKKRLKGVILSGTGASPGFMGKFGILLAKYIIARGGPAIKSPLHRSLTFENYNRHFMPNRTTADWISRDALMVDKMLADPYCFTLFSATFYMEMIRSLLRINNFRNIKKISPDIPILLASGTECAVGSYTKGTKKVYKDFIKAGVRDVKLKLYPGARHEILNETNREEVFKDMGTWLENHLNGN
jgi:alpha-beta hydrolase superfamily lysophospholipase